MPKRKAATKAKKTTPGTKFNVDTDNGVEEARQVAKPGDLIRLHTNNQSGSKEWRVKNEKYTEGHYKGTYKIKLVNEIDNAYMNEWGLSHLQEDSDKTEMSDSESKKARTSRSSKSSEGGKSRKRKSRKSRKTRKNCYVWL